MILQIKQHTICGKLPNLVIVEHMYSAFVNVWLLFADHVTLCSVWKKAIVEFLPQLFIQMYIVCANIKIKRQARIEMKRHLDFHKQMFLYLLY